MKGQDKQDHETLLQIVRGERPLSDLHLLGMTWQHQASRSHVENPRHISTAASVHDLAHGFATHVRQPEQLREWALFVDAADVDLDVDNHPDGETVLGALWDASFANPIDPSMVETVNRLAREGAKR